mmetsp:Transcript_17754/g.71585  ORF Transcript_17754/g.71585 Transcript_17754/m.71585 type:complete len:133 (-) Transcript_17754:751-1149(-)
MADTAKFFGGCTTALSAMVQLQVTHINVLSKMDLVRAVDRRRIDSFTHPDYDSLTAELNTQVDKKFSGLNQVQCPGFFSRPQNFLINHPTTFLLCPRHLLHCWKSTTWSASYPWTTTKRTQLRTCCFRLILL